MLRNCLTIAYRTVIRQTGYVGLNVLGLALGLAGFLIIGLFVRDELSYDRFHEHSERIFRVSASLNMGPTYTIGLPDPAGPYLVETRPEVTSYVRVADAGPQIVHTGGERYEETGFLRVDPSFFDVFSFKVTRGDPHESLVRPGSVLITPRLAERYFGSADPVGKLLHLADGMVAEVTGIIAEPPANSVIQFQAVMPHPAPPDDVWDLRSSGTYLLLRETEDARILKDILPEIIVERYGGRVKSATVDVEPLTKIYLYGDRGAAGASQSGHLLRGDAKYVYAFGLAAILILMVACINYVNLATARATKRAREVGVRKALGAGYMQLVRQFVFEAAVHTLVSLVLAAGLVVALLPAFNRLTDKSLGVGYLVDPMVILLFLGVGVVVTLLAGLYPAVYLASFRPVEVLKRLPSSGRGAVRLRRALVVFQFAVSAALLLSTAVMHRQLNFVGETELGFESEQLIQLTSAAGEEYESFKRALRSVPGVENVSIGPQFPGGYHGLIGFSEDDPIRPQGSLLLPWFGTDFDLLETMGMRLIAGRFFDPQRPTDSTDVVVLNESGARAFGWEPTEAPNKVIDRGEGRELSVIGVVEDFHLGSLRQKIQPLALRLMTDDLLNRGRVFVRISPSRIQEALEGIQSRHLVHFDDSKFSYKFLDDAFAAQYEADKRLSEIAFAFSMLAVVIAILGVIGLAAHAAQRRTKEIGVRKVLGATGISIVSLLSKEMVILVGGGFVIGAVLAYAGMNRWLEEFAYQPEFGASPFLLVGAGLILLAVVVSGVQGMLAARTNPVTELRYE